MLKLTTTIAAFGALLSACSLVPDVNLPVPNINLAGILGFDKTEDEKAWRLLESNSDVRRVSDDQLIIEAWGRPLTDMETIEIRLLARSGAEAARLGYSHFAILHLRDRNLPIAGGLYNDSIFGADEQWIGSYDALVRSRYERDYSAAPRSWAGPGLTAVVQLLKDDDARSDEAFEAYALYENLKTRDMLR